MAERAQIPWCFARRFTEAELQKELLGLYERPSSAPRQLGWHQGFEHYHSEAVIARERPGTAHPGGAYDRACRLVACFEFSDPRIVVGRFEPGRPLLGRPLLLELKALGLRFLAGVRVTALYDEVKDDVSTFAYRYETLVGHIECGLEWFIVEKEHASGNISFRIQASWREGEFPNSWTRLGFKCLGPRYQRAWHRLAYLRMRRLLSTERLPPLPPRSRILQQVGTPLETAPIRAMTGRAARPEVALEQMEHRKCRSLHMKAHQEQKRGTDDAFERS